MNGVASHAMTATPSVVQLVVNIDFEALAPAIAFYDQIADRPPA